MDKCIIVAISDNNAIGKDNALLWHISEDMKFFRKTTMGSPVIMGRKTYDSIGRPLPKRLNIVITRSTEAPEGTFLANSLDEAFALAESETLKAEGVSPARCFVMGGGQIYAQALEAVDRMIITHVHTVIEGADTFFPQVDDNVWTVESRSELMTDPETGLDFEFVEYIRK